MTGEDLRGEFFRPENITGIDGWVRGVEVPDTVAMLNEVVRLRAKLQTARDGIAKIIMHTGRLPNASPDFLAALGGDDA